MALLLLLLSRPQQQQPLLPLLLLPLELQPQPEKQPVQLLLPLLPPVPQLLRHQRAALQQWREHWPPLPLRRLPLLVLWPLAGAAPPHVLHLGLPGPRPFQVHSAALAPAARSMPQEVRVQGSCRALHDAVLAHMSLTKCQHAAVQAQSIACLQL